MSYELKGGGGTDFDANYTYMKEQDINPKKFIMFTDGYPFGSWGDENYCDTLFIIHGTTSIVPPFGAYAYYEEEAQG
jgi:predicted metal-dependent peptidase